MRKHTAVLIALLALSLPALALAATPKFPAKFSGGGGGAPVKFSLDKKGRATSAFFAFSCKNVNGIGVAKTDKKHKPSGQVKNGKITITYSAKRAARSGTVKATLKATFTTKTHAKGTLKISGGNCKSPRTSPFTADKQ